MKPWFRQQVTSCVSFQGHFQASQRRGKLWEQSMTLAEVVGCSGRWLEAGEQHSLPQISRELTGVKYGYVRYERKPLHVVYAVSATVELVEKDVGPKVKSRFKAAHVKGCHHFAKFQSGAFSVYLILPAPP